MLRQWNSLDTFAAALQVLPCCGSKRWADRLAGRRPFHTADELLQASDEVWHALDITDWDEAFSTHPRIGETKAPGTATAQAAKWSSEEQSAALTSEQRTQTELQHGNAAYEQRFGRIYIVCATGKSMEEMLTILRRRLKNDAAQELIEAAEQQRQITQIRLKKWLAL